MHITKLGHCCLLIEEQEVCILTDPGSYSTEQNRIKDIDIILITHEHADHLHVDSLKTVLDNNPRAKVITNKGVAKILEKEHIPFTLLEHGQEIAIAHVHFAGFGKLHADIHSSIPPCPNTGYFIANKLFYPGDAFTNPHKHVEVLALPVAGPWMKVSEAIAYAEEVKPNVCFPVHDGMLHPERLGPVHRLPATELPKSGIRFVVLEQGQCTEF